jgi:hypothetical protein
LRNWSARNGFTVAISPEPGLTGESEGAVSRTGLAKVQQRIEAVGRELRSRNGKLATGGHFGGAKGRCEMPAPAGWYAGDLQGANPQLSKGAAGSREVIAGYPAAKL